MRARLARAGLEGQADEVIRWLAGLGYLDDTGWAAARARTLLARGRAGPRLAERRLIAAGIAPSKARAAVAAAIAEAAGSHDPLAEGGGDRVSPRHDVAGEAALCRALAARRARTADLAGLDERGRARLARFLLGRGFSPRVVAATLGVYEDG